MSRLELPNGDTIEPGDVILFEGYPYRYVGGADRGDGEGEDEVGDGGNDRPAFRLSPIYWGDSDLDLRFADQDDLHDRWGPESRGSLSEAEWRAWLDDAREDPQFGDAELDAIASAVLPPSGPLDRLRRLL